MQIFQFIWSADATLISLQDSFSTSHSQRNQTALEITFRVLRPAQTSEINGANLLFTKYWNLAESSTKQSTRGSTHFL